MAAKGATFENDLLKLIFNAVPIANLADNAASSPLTNLYVSLHTASPADGDQSTNEAAYPSYARVAVARSSAGWTVTGGSVAPIGNISFPTATGGSEIETFVGVGTSPNGAGKLLYYGSLTPAIVVSDTVTPALGTGSSITES